MAVRNRLAGLHPVVLKHIEPYGTKSIDHTMSKSLRL